MLLLMVPIKDEISVSMHVCHYMGWGDGMDKMFNVIIGVVEEERREMKKNAKKRWSKKKI